jgi:hypothetical protein
MQTKFSLETQKLKKLYPDEILRFRLIFDDDKMKLSLNKVWSGWPWTQWVRKAAADLWHEDIWYFLEDAKIPKINEKVNVFFEFYFSTWSWGSRQLDSSNCGAMAKMVEDALKYDKKKNPKWILVDDTNAQVGWVALHSIELPLKARKELETSYVDVSIRKFKEEL